MAFTSNTAKTFDPTAGIFACGLFFQNIEHLLKQIAILDAKKFRDIMSEDTKTTDQDEMTRFYSLILIKSSSMNPHMINERKYVFTIDFLFKVW